MRSRLSKAGYPQQKLIYIQLSSAKGRDFYLANMKFGKEFLCQMVPEWQEVYLDYNHLRTVLKEVRRSREPEASDGASKLKRRGSLYRAFSGLTARRRSPKMQEEAIFTNIVQRGSDECYQSMLCASSLEHGGENELLFFRRLDDEFNKVVGFYKKEVRKLMLEAEELSKQMDILVALRIKVEKPDSAFEDSNQHVSLTGSTASSTSTSTSTVKSTHVRTPRKLSSQFVYILTRISNPFKTFKTMSISPIYL